MGQRQIHTGLVVALLSTIGASSACADMRVALRDAAKQNKHVFALFVRNGDANGAKMKRVFTEARRTLGSRALFRVADVGDRSESAFVQKYGIDRAPLPLTIVFAPNGAIVRAFPGKVTTTAELSKAFASPAFADVMKAMQDRKLVLLCAQGKGTRHNSESLAAARGVAKDKRAAGVVTVVRAAPEDAANANLLKPLKADSSLKEATVYILVPPSVIAGKVEGATTKEAVWAALVKGVSACQSGGGSSCCPAPK